MLQLENRRCSGDRIREDWREGYILGHLGLSYSSMRDLLLWPPFSILGPRHFFCSRTGRAETRSSAGDRLKAGSIVGPQRLESVVRHSPKLSLYRISSITADFGPCGAASVFAMKGCGGHWAVARPGRFNHAADAGSRCGRPWTGQPLTAARIICQSNQSVNDNVQGVPRTGSRLLYGLSRGGGVPAPHFRKPGVLANRNLIVPSSSRRPVVRVQRSGDDGREYAMGGGVRFLVLVVAADVVSEAHAHEAPVHTVERGVLTPDPAARKDVLGGLDPAQDSFDGVRARVLP